LIFPNPSKGIFTLQSENENIVAVEIQNSLGEVVFQDVVNLGQATLNLNNQSKGIYFLTFKTDSGIFVEKIILQ